MICVLYLVRKRAVWWFGTGAVFPGIFPAVGNLPARVVIRHSPQDYQDNHNIIMEIIGRHNVRSHPNTVLSPALEPTAGSGVRCVVVVWPYLA